jgi:hypothetical protein
VVLFVIRLLNKFGIQRMVSNFINIVMHVHFIRILVNLNEVLINTLVLMMLNHELLLLHLSFS